MVRFIGAAILLGSFGLMVNGQPAPSATASLPAGTSLHRDLAYVPGGHERQKLDLYIPKGAGKLPLLIYIHGGAFMAGSKERGAPLDYLKRGYAVASINYRLSQCRFQQYLGCEVTVRAIRPESSFRQLALMICGSLRWWAPPSGIPSTPSQCLQ